VQKKRNTKELSKPVTGVIRKSSLQNKTTSKLTSFKNDASDDMPLEKTTTPRPVSEMTKSKLASFCAPESVSIVFRNVVMFVTVNF